MRDRRTFEERLTVIGKRRRVQCTMTATDFKKENAVRAVMNGCEFQGNAKSCPGVEIEDSLNREWFEA
jgi:hypothetical protein